MDSLTVDQRALADLMSSISQDHYSAGWMMGLEYDLWRIVIGETDRYVYPLGDHEIQGLREMSDRVGGWIVWRMDYAGETYVPMEEWKRIYAAPRRSW
jgi:hypothetical protein